MWDEKFRKELELAWKEGGDTAHDVAHIMRVLSSARIIVAQEGGNNDIITPAIWFHDLVNLPKDHPDRSKASLLSADKAMDILEKLDYPSEHLKAIHHAITAHSFSAGIKPETLEARIVQDADRLDALGAIGIARTFAVSGALGKPVYNLEDPFAKNRDFDDKQYGIDHFEVKLFKLPESLHTDAARALACERVQFMRDFLNMLEKEIETPSPVNPCPS